MGKSGDLFGAGLRCGCAMLVEECAQAGEAVQPALMAGFAQVGQMVRLVVGMAVRRADGGAEKVEVDAVHGLRPNLGSCFMNVMKCGIFRIRKFLGT